MDLLSNLNDKQKKAVLTINGPVLILAGPGSGKTKTLTHRIAYLISKGINPKNILAVTFTNKAAGEMKKRVFNLLSSEAVYAEINVSNLPWMGTFHAICLKILKKYAVRLGYTSDFVIYDDGDQLSLLKKIMKELEIDIKQFSPGKVRSAISRAKDNLITPEEYEARAKDFFEKKTAPIYKKYQTTLKESNAFDFGDLIMQSVLLLETYEYILKNYQNTFKYILVDEYQDTNTAQNAWLTLLANMSTNICVVGDDAQAIYSWRNAKVENILNFQKKWPDVKIIKLEQNYRSTQNIVEAASNLIKQNKKNYNKNLWTQNASGELINVVQTLDERTEAEFILNEIQNLIESSSYRLNDFVILYRTNAQSRVIEEVFLRNDTPYKIVGGTRFYQRQEIKDLLAWLRLLKNKNDIPSFDRLQKLKLSLLRENIEEKPKNKKDATGKILNILREEYKKEKLTLRAFIELVIGTSNFQKILQDGTDRGEERWQNVQELLSVTQDYSSLLLSEAVSSFLEDVTLMQETDKIEYKSDLVHLMTIHMAKGLEFPVVFIAGCEEGLLPHSNSLLSSENLEEERRLLYVALTRAKKIAYLLFATKRMLWGKIQANPPSSFLFEIPEKYLNFKPFEEEDAYLDIIDWN